MNTLKIGQHCPVHKGIYAGIARSFSSEPESHIILLDAKSPEEYMNWAEATTWAESLGEGTSLPTKHEAALVGCNLTEELGDYGYVWTSTSDGALRAWFQPWGSSAPGSLVSICKTSGCRARAVKRLPVTFEMKGHPLATPAQAAAPIKTLTEAIAHAKEVAKGESTCALEHAKLAAWLTELQLLRADRAARGTAS